MQQRALPIRTIPLSAEVAHQRPVQHAGGPDEPRTMRNTIPALPPHAEPMFARCARSLGASLALALTLALGPSGCSTPAATTGPARTATGANLAAAPAIRPAETFDAVWTTVRDEHFDVTLNGVDWDAVRDELRPRAERASSAAELRAVLGDMLGRLGQSHFAIIPAEPAERAEAAGTPARVAATTDAGKTADAVDATAGAAPSAPTDAARAADATSSTPGIAGIDIALVEGEPTVLRVTPDLAGDRAGVLVGWRLVSVDGRRVDALLAPIRAELEAEILAGDDDSPRARQLRGSLAFAGSEMLSGMAGERLEAVFADASGGERRVAIELEPAPLGTTKFGNLPPFPVEVESRIVELSVEGAEPGAPKPIRIGVLSFNIWMIGASDAIDRAVDSMRGCDGIVLDLRGNPGGVGAMSMGVAGHFLREPASLGSMFGRESVLEFRASPRKVSAAGKRVRPYATRPLAILLDGRSASTTEVFAAGLQDIGRARVFGETSAGMALPAQAKELPNGDVLLHAVADFVTPKGARVEGRGVIPDEPVMQTREALLAGQDLAFAAASEWIRTAALTARATRLEQSAPSLVPPGAMPSTMPFAMPN